MAARTRMHAVRNNFLGKTGVLRVRLLEHGDHGTVQIGGVEMLAVRQLFHKLRVSYEHRVVTALERRLAGDVVVGGWLDGRDTQFRKRRLHVMDNLFVPGSVLVKNGLVESPVASIIHAQHDGHHGGAVWNHIAAEPHISGAAATSAHPVAAPARVHEFDLHRREACHNVALGEGRVKALVRDAVPVKHHGVAVIEGKVLRCCDATCQRQAEYEYECECADHRERPVYTEPLLASESTVLE